MGKYNLGVSTTEISPKINKRDLFVAQDMEWIQKDLNRQYKTISEELEAIHYLLQQLSLDDRLSKAEKNDLKGWSRKCSSQAKATDKVRYSLQEKVLKDQNDYKISLLDKRIEALEKTIASMKV